MSWSVETRGIYLSTHLAKEVLGNQVLSQEPLFRARGLGFWI